MRLLRVAAPGCSADFSVAADAPLATLLPLLAMALGVDPAGKWVLVHAESMRDEPVRPTPSSSTATLAEMGVLNGDGLALVLGY